MRNIYTCGYDLRVGYTERFNDGLTGKANKHQLSETEWNSPDKLDSMKSPYYVRGMHTLSIFQTDGEISEYHKTVYNWGYQHGNDARELMKQYFPNKQFEQSMLDFAECMKILYLQINKERYLEGITSMDPEDEKAMRHRLMDRFTEDGSKMAPEKPILLGFQKCLSENKLQRAIDDSANYFSDQRDLNNFCFSLTLKSKLMRLRNVLRNEEIEKEAYLYEKRKLEDSMSERINKCLYELC